MRRSQAGIPDSFNTRLLEGNQVLTMEDPKGLSPHVDNKVLVSDVGVIRT